MRSLSLLIILYFGAIAAYAQGNSPRKPRIVSQQTLTMNEDEPFTVQMSYLRVQDIDDWFYPWGFTMQLYSGENYTFDGHIVTPVKDFFGTLVVPVTVHDGEHRSEPFQLSIAVNPVNDPPVITGHSALSIRESETLTVLAEHLKVTDPDDRYPEDFVLRLYPGNNYTASGSQITPAPGFAGTLNVSVSVNDGTAESAIYSLPVTVSAINRVPQITGQTALQINEDESLKVLLSHLTVVDEDSNYPSGFTLGLHAGENYTISEATVIPSADFFGRLIVPVTVSDGANTSKPFDLSVTVLPVSDIPSVVDLETDPLHYRAGDGAVAISKTVLVEEPDGDSIMFAKVAFSPETYQRSIDKLIYPPAPNSKINGVFDADNGVLTLLGQASPASYTRAIRAIQFENMVPSPELNKTLSITVNDGKSESEQVTRQITFGRASISLDIPTGFTPNGDFANDTWKILPMKEEETYDEARVRVFNKAGTLVFESTGFETEWDGRYKGELLPADTYFYTIDLKINAPEGYLKGTVSILR